MQPILRAVLVICGLMLSCGDSPPVTFFDTGGVQGDIVVSAKATDIERFAAEELRSYLSRMSGKIIEVVDEGRSDKDVHIYVGKTAAAGQAGIPSFEPDPLLEGYAVGRVVDGLVICGFSDLGSLYGVYAFLEEYGVRWYVPGPLGEVVPEEHDLVLGNVRIEEKPDYTYRWIGSNEWSRRNRCNVNLPMEDGTIGVKIWRSFHSFGDLLHPRDYFTDHPEYFSLVKGRRRQAPPDPRAGDISVHGTQFCTSSPEVVRTVAVSMGKLLDADPQIKVITLGPNDGHGYCDGVRCTSLDEKDVPGDQSHSRRLLLFFNAASRIIGQTHPDRIVKFGAYHIYTRPPDDPHLKARDNMMVMIAHYADYANSHAIGDPESERNARFRSLLDGWKTKVNSLFIYEYYWKVNWLGLPWPIIHSIAADIPYLKRKYNSAGLYTQYADNNAWSLLLNYYVAARLLWDIDTDVPALLDEFYKKFYGPAAGPMKAVYETLENAVINSGLEFSGSAGRFAHWVFTPTVLDQCEKLLREAEGLAVENPERARVEKVRIVMEYTNELMPFLRPLNMARKEGAGTVAERLKWFDESYAAGQLVLPKLRNNFDRYHGVIEMHSQVDPNLYLDRRMERTLRWKKELQEKQR